MYWQLINTLLDKLDSVLNSNSFWIELEVPDGDFDLRQTLVQHLKSGSFHFKLVQQDIERDYISYSTMVFPPKYDQPIFLQRPGNTWNGKTKLKIKEITISQTQEMLIDILTGGTKFLAGSPYETPLVAEEASKLVHDVANMLQKEIGSSNKFERDNISLEVYLIEPDFLTTNEEYENSCYIDLGYFENAGRDLALCFRVDDTLHILLTNGGG